MTRMILSLHRQVLALLLLIACSSWIVVHADLGSDVKLSSSSSSSSSSRPPSNLKNVAVHVDDETRPFVVVAAAEKRRISEDEDHEDHDDDHDDEDHDRPWGAVIGASLIVNLVTLSGVILLIPFVSGTDRLCFLSKGEIAEAAAVSVGLQHPDASLQQQQQQQQEEEEEQQQLNDKTTPTDKKVAKLLDIAIPSFACGALLATAVFLVIPEAMHLIAKGIEEREGPHESPDDAEHDHEGEGEAEVNWRFGAAIMGGFLLPVVLGGLFPRASEHECDEECAVVVSGAGGTANDSQQQQQQQQQQGDERVYSQGMATDYGGEFSEENSASAGIVVADAMTGVPAIVAPPSPQSCTEADDEEECASCAEEENENNTTKDVEKDVHGEDAQAISVDHGHSHSHHHHDDHHQELSTKNKSTKKTSHYLSPQGSAINYRLCSSILIGDFFHNYADGIFLGTAFLLCSRDVAISIMVVTVYHEIAQEIADFFLLTRHANLRPCKALVLNFCSGLSVLFGGVTILAVGDDISDLGIGVLLGVAAGVYIHIAASECVPRIDLSVHTILDRLLSIVMFVTGAVPIGLVLLNHHHCDG